MLEKLKPLIGTTGPKIKNVVEKGAVKQFALATCESNPAYYDEEYAKTTPAGRMPTPPSFVRTFDYGAVPGLEVLPPRGRVHANQEYIFYRPLYVGDIVYCQSKLADLYEKTGKSGKMLFMVTELSVYDEKGEPYARAYSTSMFKEEVLAKPEFMQPLTQVLWNPDVTPIDPAAISVGDKLGPIEFPAVTNTGLARYGGASGDFNPLHFETEGAKAAGLNGVIQHGMLTLALTGNAVDRLLAGKGRMTNFNVRFSAMVSMGDVLTFNAEVTAVAPEGAGKKVDCDIVVTNPAGVAVLKATATLALDA